MLAPLTALLVLQASVFQTITAGLRKAASPASCWSMPVTCAVRSSGLMTRSARPKTARGSTRALRVAPEEVTAHEVALRSGLEALDHSALYLRGLARSIVDSGRDPGDAPTRDPSAALARRTG